MPRAVQRVRDQVFDQRPVAARRAVLQRVAVATRQDLRGDRLACPPTETRPAPDSRPTSEIKPGMVALSAPIRRMADSWKLLRAPSTRSCARHRRPSDGVRTADGRRLQREVHAADRWRRRSGPRTETPRRAPATQTPAAATPPGRRTAQTQSSQARWSRESTRRSPSASTQESPRAPAPSSCVRRRSSRATCGTASSTRAILRGHHDLQQQVDEVHQRDARPAPTAMPASRRSGCRAPASSSSRTETRCRPRRSARRPRSTRCRAAGSAKNSVRTPVVNRSSVAWFASRNADIRKRRHFDRAGRAIAGQQHGDAAGLDREHQDRAAGQDDARARRRTRRAPPAAPAARRPSSRWSASDHQGAAGRTGCRRRPSATRTSPPTIGTATSVLNSVSATNWTSTTCQFAAVTRAPRFRESFSRVHILQ